MDGTNVETVINKHLATADGIAVDWIAKVKTKAQHFEGVFPLKSIIAILNCYFVTAIIE